MEPKGDLAIKAHLMAERFGRKSIYFDPSYKNCPKFNPLSGREVDVVENIATTFKMLDPDSPQFFKDLNEQLTRNAIKVLKRLDKNEGVDGKYATLIWLNRLLQNSGGQGRELVNSFSKIISFSISEHAPTLVYSRALSIIRQGFSSSHISVRVTRGAKPIPL